MTFNPHNLDESGKVVLDGIYNRDDPRAYFSTLGPLDYSIPHVAKPVFEQVMAAYRRLSGKRHLKIIDIGCSYGINAALLKHDLEMADLYRLYDKPGSPAVRRKELVARDRAQFADNDGDRLLEMVGIDQAEKAVGYALEAGILDEGLAADLESGCLTENEQETLSGADLVISTGCVGYVGTSTFKEILGADTEARPWMANFVLRMFSFEPLRALFEAHGYVTEKTKGRVFRQRRFACVQEREEVLAKLAQRGIDVSGREEDGWLYAEFYLSRPAEAARRMPLSDITARLAAARQATAPEPGSVRL